MKEHPPLEGAAGLYGPIAIALATFLIVLDNTITNVCVAAISGDLSVSPSQGAWIVTSYAMANAMSLPLTGWLTRRLGQVRLFFIAIAGFTLFSTLSGFATSLEALVILRVLTGISAGPIFPLSQTLLLGSYPPEKAGVAIGMWSMVSLVAPVAGPLLGGYIVDSFSWPWIFFVKLPVGVVVLVVSWIFYRHRESERRPVPIDAIGVGLLLTWVASLQLALDLGKRLDWFDSPVVVALACAAVASFVLFLAWELIDNPHPVIELALFKRRGFALGVIAATLGQASVFSSMVLLPLWMQTVLGYGALQAGLLMAPVGILAIVVSGPLARNVDRLDLRWIVTFSLLLFSYIWYLRSEFTLEVDPWTIAIPAFLQGLAMVTHFLPLTRITLDGLPPEHYPAGVSLMNFARQTGSAIGVSVAVTAWDLRTQQHRAHLAENVTRFDPATGGYLDALGNAGLQGVQALAGLDRVLETQARMLATSDIFWASAILCFFLAGFVWVVTPTGRVSFPGRTPTPVSDEAA